MGGIGGCLKGVVKDNNIHIFSGPVRVSGASEAEIEALTSSNRHFIIK